MKKFNVGVLGATGVVGQEILNILIERDFPINELYAIASNKSKGKVLSLSNEEEVIVTSLEDIDTTKIDILLCSAGSSVAEKYLTDIAKKGTIVIDNSSYFRTDTKVPLIIPEINPGSLKLVKNKNIIANPNCSTICMLMALAGLHRISPINKVMVSTYQSVSGAGKNALDELFEQTKDIYSNKSIMNTKKVFTKQIAFNAIPHIDRFLENGYTNEEWKMNFEAKKILEADFNVSATCVRVPVFVSHAMSVYVELTDYLSIDKVKDIWKQSKGISVIDYRQDEGYVTQVEAAGEDNVFISRIREDISLKNGLSFWVVADNLRKGAALNAVQIAEMLIKSRYIENVTNS